MGTGSLWEQGASGNIELTGTESFWENRTVGTPKFDNTELLGTQSFWKHRASGNTELWEHRASGNRELLEHRASGYTELWEHLASGNTELWEHRASGNTELLGTQSRGKTELLETQSSWEQRAVGTQSFWEHRAVGTKSVRSFGITERNKNGEDPTTAERMACYAVYRLHTRQEFSKCRAAPLLHINSCSAYGETCSPGCAAVYGGFQPLYRFSCLKLLDSCR